MLNIFLILCAQIIYSAADLGQRVLALRYGYGWHLLTKPLFLLILVVPALGLLLQIFVLSRYEVSKTITVLGIFAVTVTPIMGVFLLKERFTPVNWIGVGVAVLAIFLVTSK